MAVVFLVHVGLLLQVEEHKETVAKGHIWRIAGVLMVPQGLRWTTGQQKCMSISTPTDLYPGGLRWHSVYAGIYRWELVYKYWTSSITLVISNLKFLLGWYSI